MKENLHICLLVQIEQQSHCAFVPSEESKVLFCEKRKGKYVDQETGKKYYHVKDRMQVKPGSFVVLAEYPVKRADISKYQDVTTENFLQKVAEIRKVKFEDVYGVD